MVKHMSPADRVFALIDAAFAECARPEHFTNYEHCDECAEHDELLRTRNRQTLTLEDVGNPGWDPITYCTSEGIAFYLPSLVRLALDIRAGGQLNYAQQLMFQFRWGGDDNPHYAAFTPVQRHAIAALAAHLIEHHPAETDRYADELFQIHEHWSA